MLNKHLYVFEERGMAVKKNQLPEQVIRQLISDGIKESDILDVCPVDLSFEGEYISGYLFMTAGCKAMGCTGVVVSGPEENQVRYFRGTKTKDMIYGEDTHSYTYQLYPLEDIEHLKIERQLATNLVTAEVRGICTRLAANQSVSGADEPVCEKF